MRTLFKNAKLVLLDRIVEGEILVEDDKIFRIVFEGQIDDFYDEVVDVETQYLSAGFIETHSHGAGGYDFMDATKEAVYGACKAHMKHGTTSIMPTTVTGSEEELLSYVDFFNTINLEEEGCPNILGLHLEGPYFAYNQRGAQNPKYLRNPKPEEYLEVLRRTDRIKRWSFAVELEGSDEFLKTLSKHNIVSSLAHSDAMYDDVIRAYNNGITALTHFYSCMTTVKRVNAFRVAGAIEAGYLIDDLYLEVIADNRHVPKEILQLMYKVKGADKVLLVTDSMRAAGMLDGKYVIGNIDTGTEVIKEDGVAKLMDRTAFAGSVATSDLLVRNIYQLTNAPLYDAVKMATYTPAKLVKIDNAKGSLEVGKDADLIVFDDKINVNKVMVRGKMLVK